MPRARNIENRGYPKSWRFRYDAYYYRVPKGQEHLWDGKSEFRLGCSLGEAAAEPQRLGAATCKHCSICVRSLATCDPEMCFRGTSINMSTPG